MCKHTKLIVLAHLKRCVQHTHSVAMHTQIGVLQESVPSTANLVCIWRQAEHTVYARHTFFYSMACRENAFVLLLLSFASCTT